MCQKVMTCTHEFTRCTEIEKYVQHYFVLSVSWPLIWLQCNVEQLGGGGREGGVMTKNTPHCISIFFLIINYLQYNGMLVPVRTSDDLCWCDNKAIVSTES